MTHAAEAGPTAHGVAEPPCTGGAAIAQRAPDDRAPIDHYDLPTRLDASRVDREQVCDCVAVAAEHRSVPCQPACVGPVSRDDRRRDDWDRHVVASAHRRGELSARQGEHRDRHDAFTNAVVEPSTLCRQRRCGSPSATMSFRPRRLPDHSVTSETSVLCHGGTSSREGDQPSRSRRVASGLRWTSPTSVRGRASPRVLAVNDALSEKRGQVMRPMP